MHLSGVSGKYFNTYHARDRREQMTGVSRRQVQNILRFEENFEIIELHVYIRNYHGASIQISTNLPSIGEIALEIKMVFHGKTHVRVLSFNT